MAKAGIFIVFLSMVVFSSCKEEKASTTNITFLLDITDEKFNTENFDSENINSILKLMNLDKEQGGFSGGEVRVSLINDVSDSKSKKTSIATAQGGLLGQNPLIRRDEVLKFYAELQEIFESTFETTSWGTSESKIYQKTVRELIKLKRAQGDRKVLIIYSDMLENSNLFSFYSQGWKANIEKMLIQPEKVLQELAINGPAMPDISEIEIFVVTSRDNENDEKINYSERLWTALFQTKGANVRFNSVLDI